MNKLEIIKKVINAEFGFDVSSRSQKDPIPDMKRIYSKISYDMTDCTYGQIGRFLGGYDHSNIQHHYNKATDFLETDKRFVQRFNAVLDKLPPLKLEDMEEKILRDRLKYHESEISKIKEEIKKREILTLNN